MRSSGLSARAAGAAESSAIIITAIASVRRRAACPDAISSSPFLVFDRKLFEQRLQQVLVGAPTPDRGPIDRLAHLARARGPDRALGLVEFEAPIIPRQPAVIQD